MTRRTLGARASRRARLVFLSAIASVLGAAPLAAQKGPVQSMTGLPPEIISLACAPTLAEEVPAVPLRITGGQDSVRRLAFAPGDLVTINAGTRNGITVGQQFFTRRPLFRGRVTPGNPATIRTTGWIRVYAVDDNLSLATISHACETVDVNDYLEPFALPTMPPAGAASGPPERDNYARVLSGQDRRTSFGKGDYLMIDRGTNQGVTAGARFVLYHDIDQAENFLFQVGEGIVVDVKPDSSTLLVLSSIDAILAGDYAGMRK